MNSIVYYVKGKPMPAAHPVYTPSSPIWQQSEFYTECSLPDDSYYVNHEVFSNLGPRTDADSVIGNLLVIDDL